MGQSRASVQSLTLDVMDGPAPDLNIKPSYGITIYHTAAGPQQHTVHTYNLKCASCSVCADTAPSVRMVVDLYIRVTHPAAAAHHENSIGWIRRGAQTRRLSPKRFMEVLGERVEIPQRLGLASIYLQHLREILRILSYKLIHKHIKYALKVSLGMKRNGFIFTLMISWFILYRNASVL